MNRVIVESPCGVLTFNSDPPMTRPRHRRRAPRSVVVVYPQICPSSTFGPNTTPNWLENASQRNGPHLPDRSEPRTAACVFATVGSTVVDLKTAGFTAGRLKDAEFTPRYACNGSSIGLVDIPNHGLLSIH